MDPTSWGERKHKHFLQCSYLDRVYQQSPHLKLLTLTPGMYMHTIRLTGKARLVKASGQQIALHFEHKNSIPFLAHLKYRV